MVKRGLTLALLAGGLAWAEPSGPQVIHGGVNIQNIGPTTQINQTTDRAIINWNGFNIDVHELVRFVQPNQLSVILNRVVGADPSNILGQLQANGRVFLTNPNGIVFGPNARVDVGGLMATTLNLSDQDFLAGRYHLTQDPSKGLAAVVNQGELRVAEGGFLLLVAPMVDNQGVIVAKAGQVGLVGSSDATINFDGQGLVEIRVPQAQIANPGTVALAPQAVSEVLRQVVADPEIVEAGRLPRGEGLVIQEGSVEAGRVLLNSTQATLVAPGSHTSGQDVRILSSGLSRLDGNVQGDFVELSGRRFGLSGSVTANQFLLDPETIHITDTNAPAPLDSYLPNVLLADDAGVNEISRGALESLLPLSNVSLEAQHLIQVDNMASNQINLQFGVTLHMTVFDGDIVFQDTRDQISTTFDGSFRFDAPQGNIVLGDVSAPGGAVDVQAGHDILLGVINAGNTRLQAGNDILNATRGSGAVQGGEASFEAGNRVGTATDPIHIDVGAVSGLAREFNFTYDGSPSPEGLVNGINGLNIRPALPQPDTLPVLPPYNPGPDTTRVDQIPVFQINENTSSFYQPPKVVLPPEAQSGAQPSFDAGAILKQLESGSAQFEVDPYQLTTLLETLGDQGWRARLTGDRLQGQKGTQKIEGEIHGSQATLRLNVPGKLGEAPDGFAFLMVGGLQKNVQVCDSQKFVYQLGPDGLMPWIEAFAAHGFRVRTTDEHFEAWRGEEKAEGIVSGQRFFLKVGPHSCFAASDDDADLQELVGWLLQSSQFPLLSQARMVDTTRLKLQGSLPKLVAQLKRHGWTFAPGDRTAVRGHYRLNLNPAGSSLRLTLSRTP